MGVSRKSEAKFWCILHLKIINMFGSFYSKWIELKEKHDDVSILQKSNRLYELNLKLKSQKKRGS